MIEMKKVYNPSAFIVFNASAFIVLFYALWVGYTGKVEAMGFSVPLVFSLLLFANIEKFSEFTAGVKGFSAKTRKVIDEANAVSTEIKQLAKVLVENQISSLIHHMRVSSIGESEKENIKDELLDRLRSIDIPEDEVQETLGDWYKYMIRDYSQAIIGEGGSEAAAIGISQECYEEYKEFRKRTSENPVTPDELEQFFGKFKILTPDKKGQIEDYRYYLKEKKHRRPDEWEDHELWKLVTPTA